ncbi:Serine/threonine kinase SAD-1 [Diplonema papillatum]|nr:Serine/threonine kinase SAD-1 [Diplonema papillatum]
MSESNVITFNVALPGARRTHELVFTLGDTLEEKYGCIKVKSASDRDENEMNVWVIIRSELASQPNAKEIEDSLNLELGVLKLLDHRNVMKLFQVFASDGHTYIVTERCTSNLAKLVKKNGGKLSPLVACRLFNQLLSAVSYMHGKGLAHRNINPWTVLLDEENETANVKLGEFSDACLQSSKDLLDSRPAIEDASQMAFVAPEVRGSEKYHGKKADAFSCAAVLYFMLTGKLPPSDGAEAATDPAVIEPAKEVVQMGMHKDWKRVDDQGRYGIDDIRMCPWVSAERKHSSTGDVAAVVDAQMLRRSQTRASGVGFNRDIAPLIPSNRLGGGGLTLDTNTSGDNEDAGMSSPESLIDDSFSPLPKRGPLNFMPLMPPGECEAGELVVKPNKSGLLVTTEDADGLDFLELSPPASPSSKSKKAMKLDTLNDGCHDGVAEDAAFEASPMGKKAHRRMLPESAMDQVGPN